VYSNTSNIRKCSETKLKLRKLPFHGNTGAYFIQMGALAVINYNVQAIRVIWARLCCPKAVSNQLAPHSYQMDGNH
jgi:hypothetical protein